MVSQIRPFGADITSGQGLFSDPLTDTVIAGQIASYPTAAGSPGNSLYISATSGEPGFLGGNIVIAGGQNGFGSVGDGGYVDISGGEGLGTVAGNVYVHSGLGYGGGTTGTVFIGYTPNGSSYPDTVVQVGDQADPTLTTFNVYANTNAARTTATQAQLGSDDATNGLILVQPGGTQIGGLTGPPITLGPVYYDPANGMTIRFGASIFIDGDGVVNTINGRDATMPVNEVYYDVPGPPADQYNLATVGSGFLAQFPVVPGTVTVQVILDGGVVFSTVTDNGAGVLPASAAIPGGGTINYTTGAITGSTDVLKPYSQIVFFYVVADTDGEDLSPRGGHGEGVAAGGDLNLSGGDGGTTSGNAGSIFIVGGTPTDGNGGSITLTASDGVGTDQTGGSIVLANGSSTGTATPPSIQLAGRVCGNKAADAASANDMTLGNGNYIDVTGNTQINAIAIAGWTAGSVVILQFDSNPLVKNNTAGGAGFASLLLAGGTDFNATAGDTLTLCYDGTTWRETARTVI